jgi:hypothetical protein
MRAVNQCTGLVNVTPRRTNESLLKSPIKCININMLPSFCFLNPLHS